MLLSPSGAMIMTTNMTGTVLFNATTTQRPSDTIGHFRDDVRSQSLDWYKTLNLLNQSLD